MGVKKSDKVSIEKLHEMAKSLSVNRMTVLATHKLTRIAMDDRGGLKGFFCKNIISYENRATRSMTGGKLKPSLYPDGFRWHAIKIWNEFGDIDISPISLPL